MVGFEPDKDIPSLEGKVIFVTGGTAGLGRMSVLNLAKHKPAQIYFSGRNASAAESLIAEVGAIDRAVRATFVQMDLSSLVSVRDAAKALTPPLSRLDILMCNAGIMVHPTAVSAEGYEIHFAVNHLGHAMLIRHLLPVLERTAEMPGADIRVVILTSVAWKAHPSEGVSYSKLERGWSGWLSAWIAYGQSKYANIIYAAELARLFPSILSVSVHPGVVETDLVHNVSLMNKLAIFIPNWLMGTKILKPEEGCHSQLWVACAGKRSEMTNGAFYMPVGLMRNDQLDKKAKSPGEAKKLWEWTEKVLDRYS